MPPAGLFEAAHIPSPAFVIDVGRLAANVAVLDQVQQRTGAKVLLALKSYSCWRTFDTLSRFRGGHGPLWGVCASSVDEARLGRGRFGGEIHAFSPAWTLQELRELHNVADHVIFNTPSQWLRWRDAPKAVRRPRNKVAYGLRINPERSEVATPIYDPCSPTSHLGIRAKDFSDDLMPGITGLHVHALCENGADALVRVLDAVEERFARWLPQVSWLNFGGGHHITREDYDLDLLCRTLTAWRNRYGAQIYLEPGEAVAMNAGWLVATVLDVSASDIPVAFLDVSATCHMPDVLEMPYTPSVCHESGPSITRAAAPGERPFTCRLVGKSCLAGDVVGTYSFDAPLKPGQRLVFEDMAIYSMVKTTTFNGLRLPAILVVHCKDDAIDVLQEHAFGYTDFAGRLG
jgi:carboxynorspermidine decarboxylase